MAQLSPLAERLFRRAWEARARARAEGDQDAYDAAAFTLGLALGKHPNEAADETLTATLERVWAETAADLPQPCAPLSLVPPLPEPDGRKPVEQLATLLGLSRQQLYRRLPHMPGVSKTSDKKKSHWHIPDPEDTARRWNAGERREED
jgi:hypothetical protein